MILYDYFRSSASYRVRIALNLKGLTVEHRTIHLLKGEQRSDAYRALNPQGLVPFLIDGENAIAQSLAIIEYLDEVHPSPPLLPANPTDRAQARAIALMIACDIHPLNNTRVLATLTNDLKVSDDTKTAWYCRWITEGFTALEAMLRARKTQSAFCVGNSPTIAEICLVPQVVNAGRFKCSLDAFPTLMDIYHRADALPAFAAAHPSRQPEAQSASA